MDDGHVEQSVQCCACGCGFTERRQRSSGDLTSRVADCKVQRYCHECGELENVLKDTYCVDPESKLGDGGFGVVCRGVFAATGEACAVKTLEADAMCIEEVRLQEKLCHPNVCRLFGYVRSNVKLCLALELCSGGDLHGLIYTRGAATFSWKEVQTYTSELLSATAYLHSLGYVHRDIKPSNVLLQAVPEKTMWCVKLADFGLAALCAPGKFLTDCAGTVPYMAPEQLKCSCNEACDVWACGCVFFELVCGDSLVSDEVWDDRRKTHIFLFSSQYGSQLRRFDDLCRNCSEAPQLLRTLLHRSSTIP